ncbi:glycosyltransferase family 4 protein [Jejudonia soesokkakensis]|uniref:Glycosyltransferase family 4 protein n=1 Tax=Jejudonia soesokkakensis TaxID=1323432 RepID=A0ABW2MPR5_9FLAO
MHIVFLSSEYPLWSPGGIGTFLQTFGRALVAEGNTVSIVGVGETHTEEVLEDKGVTLYRLPKRKGKLPAFIHNKKVLNSKLKWLHSQHPIAILEAAEGGLALISKRFPATKIIRLHGGHHFFAEAEKRPINWRKGLLEKRSFSKADGFIAVSEYVKLHTANYLRYRNKPVKVIHHPMDTTISVPDVEVDPHRILFSGTVCEKKGVRELVQAFALVRKEFPDLHLDIFGRDWYYPDGRSYITQLQKDLEPSYFENVLFHGSIDRNLLFEKYAEALLCVFPSHMETQGLVTLEAMLLGKPVVFTEYGPGPETILHKQNGLLCDVYNPADIAEKMIWCIKHPEKAKALGENARAHVRITYDKMSILEENITFYKKCMAHG